MDFIIIYAFIGVLVVKFVPPTRWAATNPNIDTFLTMLLIFILSGIIYALWEGVILIKRHRGRV
jgi:hypothetical protein